MKTEIQVTGLTVNDERPQKTRDLAGRPAFFVSGVYHLENGTSTPTRILSHRLKHLAERIEQEKNAVQNGCVAVDGPFVVRRYHIGPKLAAA